MITAVVGHRGTGKTELMGRLQMYLRDSQVELLDLDSEIEKKIGKTIPELFLQQGETYFRELERQLFLEIVQKPHQDAFIVLGAGFDLSVIPETVRILWVKRITDLDGRIFLNRPRLHPELSPLEEYRKRALVREESYKLHSDEVYLMPEGVFDNHHYAQSIEKRILTHSLSEVGGVLTVLPEVFSSQKRWDLFKVRFAGKGIEYFELRDDLLTADQILKALAEMPAEKFIYSFRKLQDWGSFFADTLIQQLLAKMAWVDWAIELGTPDFILQKSAELPWILSLHDSTFEKQWRSYEGQVRHLKWAPLIETFEDLKSGHEWQQERPDHRSFLPRSQNGRWLWYRQYQKGRQLLNFWKEDQGSALDQPSLFAWMMTEKSSNEFAAVLGDPVYHSFTPIEHSDFFHKRGLSVFGIQIARGEWGESIGFLRKLGLSYAAVTAPHKENAAQICSHRNLKALNTLYWEKNQKKWTGTSTDDQGFIELIEGVGMLAPLQAEIFVWGGGGTLSMIKNVLPHASYFSSRTGAPREGSEGNQGLSPKVLIWAAPRSAETLMPPSEWSPAMVFDLNYRENSMGKEYAQKCGANYQSGLVMFTAQAQGQRAFWKNCEESK